MSRTQKNLNPEASLQIRERVGYGSGNFAMGFANTGISTFLLFYFTNYVGLDPMIVGTIILVSKFLDGISDIIMGNIIDHTHTKQGKARPWILRASIPFALFTVLMFSVPGDHVTVAQYIYVAVTYNLLNTVFYTMCACAYNSLTALITQNQYERGLLGVFNMFGLVFAQFIVNGFTLRIVAAFGDTRLAWTITFGIYALVGLAAQLFCYFSTTERVTNSPSETSEAKKKEENISILTSLKYLVCNKYWLQFTIMEVFVLLMAGTFYGSLTYYATYIIGDSMKQSIISNSMLVIQMIALAIAFLFIKKLGKVGTLRLGSIIMAAGLGIDIIAGSSVTGLIIGTAIAGIGNGLASSTIGGIGADTIEYGEWKFGVRTEGMAFSAVSMAQKIGSGLASALIGLVLSIGKFDASLDVQPASAITAIRVTTLILPFAFLIIISVIALCCTLDKVFPQIMADLKKRRSQQ